LLSDSTNARSSASGKPLSVSKVLVSSRASNAGRSPPNTSFHVLQTFEDTVRRLVENQRARLFLDASRRARAHRLGRQKPSKMKRSDGSPAADSAAINAQAPGTGTTLMPAARA
jgi:hypothetical protein